MLNDDKNLYGVIRLLMFRAIKAMTGFFKNLEHNYKILILWLVLGIAFFIRFSYIKWGLPYVYEWDAPYVVDKTITIMQTGDFNTHFFHYPSLTSYYLLPFYVLNYYRLMGSGYLRHINDIKFVDSGGGGWFISHPSFYAVGRFAINILGVLSIWLVYELGKRFFSRRIGLMAALIMGIFHFHRAFSTNISSNMPMAFFIVLSLYFLALFKEKRQIAFLLLSGLSAGFSVASKYNAYPIVFSLILGILFYSQRKWRDIILLSSSSAFGFFLGCPYSLFDFRNFLDQTGREVGVYTGGEPGFEGPAGMAQFKFYLSHFQSWIHNIFRIRGSWILSLFGQLVVFMRDIRSFLIIYSFPILFVIYMCQQRTNYLRNMVCITPFIALSLATALDFIYKGLLAGLDFISKKKVPQFRLIQEVVFLGLLILLTIWLGWPGSAKDAFVFMRTYKEERTKAVDYIKENFPKAKVGISSELRIHTLDLEKIPNHELFKTDEVSLSDLYTANFDYILSSDYFSYNDVRDKRVEPFENKFPKQNIIKSFGERSVNLGGFITGPKVNIYKVDTAFLNEAQLKKLNESILYLDKYQLEIIFINDSLLKNGSLENWSRGPHQKPDFFEGGDNISDDNIEREDREVKVGRHAAKIRGGNFNFTQELANFRNLKGKPLTCFVWVKSGVARKYRLQIYDGIDSSFSPKNSGGHRWELLSVTHVVNPGAKNLSIRVIQADRTGKPHDIVYVDGALLVAGRLDIFSLKELQSKTGK